MNATWNQMALLTLFLQLFAAVRKRFRPWHKFLQVFLWNFISGILFQLFHQKLKILKRIHTIGFRCFCNRIQDCTCLCSFLGVYDVPAVFPHTEFFDAAFRVIVIQRNNRWFQKDTKVFFLVHRIGQCLPQISWGYDLIVQDIFYPRKESINQWLYWLLSVIKNLLWLFALAEIVCIENNGDSFCSLPGDLLYRR